jgi:hypothetical protein
LPCPNVNKENEGNKSAAQIILVAMGKLLQKFVINFPSNEEIKAKIRRNMNERALFYQAASAELAGPLGTICGHPVKKHKCGV